MDKTILIVDDEELIRRGIIARLEYLQLKPKILYEAENGLQALEIIKKNKVDIVITDICMPDMDGLAFIQKSKEILPALQYIILSGYAEFAYAEQAIRLGVKAYLLKPIAGEELKEAIEKILLDLEKTEKQISEQESHTALEKAIYDSLKSIQGDYSLQENLRFIDKNFPLQNKKLILALLEINSDSHTADPLFLSQPEIKTLVKDKFTALKTDISKIIENNLSNPQQMFLLFSGDKEESLQKESKRVLRQLSEQLIQQGIGFSAGISAVHTILSVEILHEARDALLQRIIDKKKNLFFYDETSLLLTNEIPASELNLFHQYIDKRDMQNIEGLIQNIFSDENMKDKNILYIRLLWVRMVGILLKSTVLTENLKHAEDLMLDLEIMNSFYSLSELRAYFYSLILDSIHLERDLDTNASNKMKLAVKYIKDNYNQDIAINDLAEKFNMSPNYFSTIFKKETGETAVNFIKDLRLKKACEYLIYSDKSVSDIAKEVGYEDSQYFFKVFKKAIGQTPLQYRKTNN